jgi:hypothetical protein
MQRRERTRFIRRRAASVRSASHQINWHYWVSLFSAAAGALSGCARGCVRRHTLSSPNAAAAPAALSAAAARGQLPHLFISTALSTQHQINLCVYIHMHRCCCCIYLRVRRGTCLLVARYVLCARTLRTQTSIISLQRGASGHTTLVVCAPMV